MLDVLFITAIQIIIEALPVSSFGHILLLQLFWERYAAQPLTQLPEFFDHFLHGPTVVIVLVVFFKDWFASARRLLGAWCASLCGRRAMRWSECQLSGLFFRVFGLMCAADAMTALAYGVQYLVGKDAACFQNPYILLGGFLTTMVLLLSLRLVDRFMGSDRQDRLVWSIAVMLGMVQGVALLWPGLSRFGSTYVVGRWVGMSPRRSFQFSFLIQFPLIAAAFVINGMRDMLKVPHLGALLNAPMLVTMLASTLVAGLLFAGVYRLARQRRLWWFGVYLLVPIVVLVCLFMT